MRRLETAVFCLPTIKRKFAHGFRANRKRPLSCRNPKRWRQFGGSYPVISAAFESGLQKGFQACGGNSGRYFPEKSILFRLVAASIERFRHSVALVGGDDGGMYAGVMAALRLQTCRRSVGQGLAVSAVACRSIHHLFWRLNLLYCWLFLAIQKVVFCGVSEKACSI